MDNDSRPEKQTGTWLGRRPKGQQDTGGFATFLKRAQTGHGGQAGTHRAAADHLAIHHGIGRRA